MARTAMRGERTRDKDYQNMKDGKQDTLKKLFESMANLIYFFEAINRYPELDAELRRDAMELLGLISEKGYGQTTFQRLISAILIDHFNEESNVDYRLLLADMIHRETTKIFTHLANNGEYSDATKNLIIQNLNASQAWSETFAKQVRVKMKGVPSRIVVADIITDARPDDKIERFIKCLECRKEFDGKLWDSLKHICPSCKSGNISLESRVIQAETL